MDLTFRRIVGDNTNEGESLLDDFELAFLLTRNLTVLFMVILFLRIFNYLYL
ncbi:hypothetical protein SAMN05421640_3657 [Ekhidna lutea]|uniref:Uncharacterized protein n=1 Tax=Ekhidna lutea TaxID=447679 RepID=A0A239M5X7_EKHLU|nr:hypothetical protein SAMN05421640_3657 [Ekhidna lutea]